MSRRGDSVPQVGAPQLGRKTTPVRGRPGMGLAQKNAFNKEEARRQELLAHRLLESGFSDDELRQLCFEMGIDYENLAGTGKSGKARELVLYVKRRFGPGVRSLMREIELRRPQLAASLNLQSAQLAAPPAATPEPVQRVCYFNDGKYSPGSVVCSEGRLLECKCLSVSEVAWQWVDRC